MTNLRYYTTEVVENLRARIADHLDWYYAPEGRPPAMASIGGIRESNFNGNLISTTSSP